MFRPTKVAIGAILILGLGTHNKSGATVPTVLHYQGVLTDAGGTPITTNTSVTFTLWSAPIAGTIRWTETRSVAPDNQGRFAILLGQAVPLHDSVFKMPPLYLGVQVAADPELTPRSLLASNAFAFRISTVDGATGGNITGNTEVQATVPGDGLGVRDPGGDASSMSSTSTVFADANNDTIAQFGDVGLRFIEPSTNDTIFNYDPNTSSLEIGADNAASGLTTIAIGSENVVTGDRSLALGTVNVIAGNNSGAIGDSNQVSAHQSFAVGRKNEVCGDNSFAVGSGNFCCNINSFAAGSDNDVTGSDATIGGGNRNNNTSDWGVIAGGIDNIVGTEAYASVGGGRGNSAVGRYATIAGGNGNSAEGFWTTIGGGRANSCPEGSSTIAGGDQNATGGFYSAIGGGRQNLAGTYAACGGGWFNSAFGQYTFVGAGLSDSAFADYSVIGGGSFNRVNGAFGSVLGGRENSAGGDYSNAAGRRAKADHPGSYVWGDTTDADVSSSSDNQWTARASGGVRFYSSANLSTGVTLAAGGGSWAAVSDRNVKENIESVNGEDVLSRLSQVPIARWNYIAQGDSIRHIGPMAQDFYAAFGVGEDDRHITTIDADGVALAAIQALNLKNLALEEETGELRRMIKALQAQLNTMRAEDAR